VILAHTTNVHIVPCVLRMCILRMCTLIPSGVQYNQINPAPNTPTIVQFIVKVGQNHTYIRIYGVYTAFLAGKLPYIRSNTVHTYSSGQPYL